MGHEESMTPKSLSLFVCLALLAAVPPLRAIQPLPVVHESTLGSARVDLMEHGKVVISMDAVGELPGIITLTLEPSSTGGYTGTWAFMVAKVDNTDPATGVEPPPHGHQPVNDAPHLTAEATPHRDYVRLVHRGDLSGTVTHAAFTRNDTGAADLMAALTIIRGGLEFQGVTGAGMATLDTLRLRF
jgi:hypothetical protein